VETNRYLIIGGGMAGDVAAKAIRERDPDGSIVVVGAEEHPPYARPPLSKALWKGKEEDSIWRGTDEHGVDLKLGRRIVSLDPDARTATDDRGDTYEYDRALIATGGRPRTLTNAPRDVIYFRTVDDYYREHSVDVVAGESVESVSRDNGGFTVSTNGGRTLPGDVVVAGLGIEPRTELAEAAGLPVDDGIVVDDRGRVTGRDDLFAAGDVARFPALALDTELRVEHEDHANSHGKQVGANMAGADDAYDHLPFFYSDLFDLGYEAVGEVDSRLQTVEAWAEPNRTGVVAYVDDEGRPRGFLLWDVWGKVDDARALIRSGESVDEARLRELLA
jgi:3-phenylpropionate/trans-cinnamate dioxygenase ferredoxin reductase subunit